MNKKIPKYLRDEDNIQITVCDSKQYTDIDGQHLQDPRKADLERAVARALSRSSKDIIFIHLIAHGDRYVMHPKLAELLTHYQVLNEINVSFTLPEA